VVWQWILGAGQNEGGTPLLAQGSLKTRCENEFALSAECRLKVPLEIGPNRFGGTEPVQFGGSAVQTVRVNPPLREMAVRHFTA
jgi:hypothetical protein